MSLSRYDQDLYSWAAEQAELLRLRRYEQVDWANVIEEIADLGKSEYCALVSAFQQLALHRLRWQYQADHRSRSGRIAIANQQLAIEQLLDESPSLKSRLEEALAAGYTYGRREAANETGLPLTTFPEACPYALTALLDPELDLEPEA